MFFFDQNLSPKLVEGLKGFGEEVCHLTEYFPKDAPDTEWLEFVGKNGMFLVTRDLNIRKRPGELEALKKNNVGAFFLGGKKMGRWDQVKQLIKAWERMKDYCESKQHPFAFLINRHGSKFTEIPID